jgi:hypothetical protein
LLTNYGEISEVWFDAAKGENAKDMEYDFKDYWALVRKLQPNAVMFSDVARFEYWDGKIWKSLIAFTTVWYKRLLRFKPVILQRVRLIISAAKEKVQLSEIGFFKASSLE